MVQQISTTHYQAQARVALACYFPSDRLDACDYIRREYEDKNLTLVQTITHLSTLAVEVPALLPEIIKLIEPTQKENSEKDEGEDTKSPRNLAVRTAILVALAPHLPARINREIRRFRRLYAHTPENLDKYTELWNRSLKLLARGYRDALQGGSLRNESAQADDLLNLKDEVNALADLLLMRDLEPPMAVGILGGWGGR
ncbi:MAG: hypothetical protein AAGA75_17950 [Cyanobacteria bacterium P01_E01_bin.6]